MNEPTPNVVPSQRASIDERLHQSRLAPLFSKRRLVGPIFLVSIGVGMALALLVTSRFAFVPGVLAAFIGIGFATHVSDAPCPRCGEKFFGDPLRTFTASECKACGLAPN